MHMKIDKLTKDILLELENCATHLSNDDFLRLTEAIQSAGHIFLSGKGRSGLAISAFANRLMHLGFSVSMIGEISAPHTKKNDLLIIASGSGETGSLVSLAQKASASGVKIALITMNKNSSIGNLADICVELPGASPKVKYHTISSIQPMGSAFEQMVFLSGDAMVIHLMQELHQNSNEMFARHADLE